MLSRVFIWGVIVFAAIAFSGNFFAILGDRDTAWALLVLAMVPGYGAVIYEAIRWFQKMRSRRNGPQILN